MRNSRFESFSLMATTVASTLLIWYMITRSSTVPSFILPSPAKVIAQVQDGPSLRTWAIDVLASSYRVAGGFLMAAVAAIPVGLYAGYHERIQALTAPFVEAGRYIPIPALIPLSILWLGIGESQKLAIIFLGTFFPLTAAVSDLTRGVDARLVEVGRTLGQTNHAILWRIIAPAISPGVFDALRIAIGWAWSYLVVAEIISAGIGVGYRIMASQRYLQVGLVFAGILLLGVLGLFTDFIFRIIRRSAFRWLY